MLTQRTWVNSVLLHRSVFVTRHHFELWPSTPLVCLTGTQIEPSIHRLRQQTCRLHSHTSLPLFTYCSRRPFSNLLRRTFYKTLPLPARVWLLDKLLRRPASCVLFFGRIQHRPFGRLQHSLTPGRLVPQSSCFLYSLFCSIPTVLSRYSVMGTYCFLFCGNIFFCVQSFDPWFDHDALFNFSVFV